MTEIQPQPVGIDLGTTFCAVARLDSTGRPVTVPNADGDLTTPSVVFFDDDSIIVGKEAVKAATLEPDQIAQFAKREMGNSVFSKEINGEFFPPEVIQSLILEKLKKDTEAMIGPFEEAVITVPAYFNEPRRKATQDAGRLAGLKVLDIINEPTAAAIAYGVEGGFLDEQGESRRVETIAIFDLGGGTFDVSVMRIDGKRYKVIATDGNVKLGGIDWDQRIVDYIAESFLAKHEVDPRQDPSGKQRLFREAEDAKRSLSTRQTVTVTFEHGGRGLRIPLTRKQFEEMTANLLERTRFTITNLLRHAELSWGDITRLLVVGGSTRMPIVSEMLERESGKTVDRCLAADEAVAHGAAIYAGLLRSGNELPTSDSTITNVNSHSLGVLGIENKTGRKRNRIMIPRNTSLPVTKSAKFITHKDGQGNVVVNVIEGGDASGNNSTPIGRCVVRQLPPDLPAGTPVNVAFSYAANGRLTVHASLPSAEKEARLDIERVSGLSDSKLEEWGHRIRDGLKPLNLVQPGDTGRNRKEDATVGSSEDELPPLPNSSEVELPPALPKGNDEPPPLRFSSEVEVPPALPKGNEEPPPIPRNSKNSYDTRRNRKEDASVGSSEDESPPLPNSSEVEVPPALPRGNEEPPPIPRNSKNS